jgi:ATP-dependent Clp protease ATP-binding subunit ClpC
LELARGEAVQLGHDFIGTEHLLLALLRSENRIAVHVFKTFGLSEQLIRVDVEKIIGRGLGKPGLKTIPYTPRAKSVIDFAGREAAALDRSAIGAEHILLGLLREPEGVAGVVLRKLGADLEKARAEILKTIGPDDSAGPAPVVAS